MVHKDILNWLDLVTFTEEIINENFIFCAVSNQIGFSYVALTADTYVLQIQGTNKNLDAEVWFNICIVYSIRC